MSPFFANDMFDIIKQRDFSFYLAIFQIEAMGHFFKDSVQTQAIFIHILQNSSSFVDNNRNRMVNI